MRGYDKAQQTGFIPLGSEFLIRAQLSNYNDNTFTPLRA